jgi:hypothetical protein
MNEDQNNQNPQPSTNTPQPPTSPQPLAQETVQNTGTTAYQDPALADTPQYSVSASELGLNEPDKKFLDIVFNKRKLITWGIVGASILLVVLIALYATNIIGFGTFKSITYKNGRGDTYQLKFYSKYATESTTNKTTDETMKTLVSKVSVDGKFPIFLMAYSEDGNNMRGYKDCSNFAKAFEVDNEIIDETIAVCHYTDKLVEGESFKDKLYIAAFYDNEKTHIILIGQDVTKLDNPKNQKEAKEELNKFGMETYREDIETILSSINVQ